MSGAGVLDKRGLLCYEVIRSLFLRCVLLPSLVVPGVCRFLRARPHGFDIGVCDFRAATIKKVCSDNEIATEMVHKEPIVAAETCASCPGVPVLRHGLWKATVHMAGISATSDFSHSHLIQQSTCNAVLTSQHGSMPLGVRTPT